MIEVRRAEARDSVACVSIVQSSVEHFSSETCSVVADAVSSGDDSWVAADIETGDVAGFAVAERRFQKAAELLQVAVARDRRSAGIGTRLVAEVLTDLQRHAVEMVLVKTLDEASGYGPFDGTRAFWKRLGFIQVDRIDPLPGWQPGNPAALFVLSL